MVEDGSMFEMNENMKDKSRSPFYSNSLVSTNEKTLSPSMFLVSSENKIKKTSG